MFSLCFFYSLERLVQRLNKIRVFAFNIAPFFVFLSPKMEVRLTLDSKKAYLKSQKGSFELQKSLT